MEEVNAEKNSAHTNPKESQVAEWAAEAKTMDAISMPQALESNKFQRRALR
jgi:hypothetical protein